MLSLLCPDMFRVKSCLQPAGKCENKKCHVYHSAAFFSVVSGKLGALRLKVRLVEDRILPSVYYQPLIHLLVESVISPAEVRRAVGNIGLVRTRTGSLVKNL